MKSSERDLLVVSPPRARGNPKKRRYFNFQNALRTAVLECVGTRRYVRILDVNRGIVVVQVDTRASTYIIHVYYAKRFTQLWNRT